MTIQSIVSCFYEQVINLLFSAMFEVSHKIKIQSHYKTIIKLHESIELSVSLEENIAEK